MASLCGASIYVPSKVAFDGELPFKMGEAGKIVVSPEAKTLLGVPANDQRSLSVIEKKMLNEIISEH